MLGPILWRQTLFCIHFVFVHERRTHLHTHSYAAHIHTSTHSMCVRERKSGRVPLSHFNQNACLTYRCQTSLVLITNITEVLLLNSVSYLMMSLYYLQSSLLPPFRYFFSRHFYHAEVMLRASMYLRCVMPRLQCTTHSHSLQAWEMPHKYFILC